VSDQKTIDQKVSPSRFGFTNDRDVWEAAKAYRAAAVADGWSIAPTYNTEAVDRASTLHKDGYRMSILSRDSTVGPKWRYEASIAIWGPDGMVIKAPEQYDWGFIQGGSRRCNVCGAEDVETARFSFAGRCCEVCLPEMRAKHERGNWTA
jgi:hypothetical protein